MKIDSSLKEVFCHPLIEPEWNVNTARIKTYTTGFEPLIEPEWNVNIL